ncbi:MAG: metal ABC transporter permease [Gammaproteobacteria bacterium]|nr:MAG: metal ABC transporter permease [Gammaproteobacteria bacterium]
MELSILGPGLLAGLLVLATHVPMGREVLRRGIIFIDLAVAQTAGLGVIAAGVLGWDAHGIAAQVAAFLAAVTAGIFLTWTEKHWGEVQEAIIGALFVMAATGGILLLANHPKGGEELRDLLVGQILWVDMHVLWPAMIVTAVVLLCWYRIRERLGRIGFYMLFSISVTVAVQLVGVYLVFASLIIPALATRSMAGVSGLAAAYVIGASGYALGLLLSALFDLPSGAVIVWSLAGIAALWKILPRRR